MVVLAPHATGEPPLFLYHTAPDNDDPHRTSTLSSPLSCRGLTQPARRGQPFTAEESTADNTVIANSGTAPQQQQQPQRRWQQGKSLTSATDRALHPLFDDTMDDVQEGASPPPFLNHSRVELLAETTAGTQQIATATTKHITTVTKGIPKPSPATQNGIGERATDHL